MRIRTGAALTGIVVGVLGVAGAAADLSARGLSAPCAFDPGTGTLSIDGDGDGFSTVIVRDADEIVVTDPFGFDRQCVGPTPTVANTDLIDVTLTSFLTIFTIDLRAGAFAPGASPEDDGSPEIEIRARLRGEPIIELFGREGTDRWTLGRVPDSDGALNLNAADDEDADLVFKAKDEQIQAYLGAGKDRFAANSPPGFARPYRTIYFVEGENGRDRLVGGPGRDGFGGGRDPDVLIGSRGRDQLIADRGGADRVACGSGRDYARVDRRDRVSGCERAD